MPRKVNIAKLRAGAQAVVTGQQVVLFGGPLLTILKAATAVARAREATKATGIEHVPVFWMATEDHDLAEVDQVSFLTKTSVETLRLGLKLPHAVPVGDVVPGTRSWKRCWSARANSWSLLRSATGCASVIAPADGKKPTLALAFGRLIARSSRSRD